MALNATKCEHVFPLKTTAISFENDHYIANTLFTNMRQILKYILFKLIYCLNNSCDFIYASRVLKQ